MYKGCFFLLKRKTSYSQVHMKITVVDILNNDNLMYLMGKVRRGYTIKL